MHKKISIIIPVYNRAEFLGECIESVFKQTYQNFEVVLIDDGSTDNTLNLCQRLTQKDNRVKLLTQQHRGVSSARNAGLDAAQGEFVFFLDSDDIIHPNLLETLVNAFETHSALIGGTSCHKCLNMYWKKGRERFLGNSEPFEFTYHTHEETLEKVFHGGSPLGMIGGVMMRRELIADTRFRTDLFIGEDFYFIYENLIKGADAVFLKQKGYLIRNHEKNSSWQYDFNGFWTRFYRRKLVWQSEEVFGRTEYANIQKRDAFGCFVVCFKKNKPYSENSKKMQRVLRQHKKEMLPALNIKTRLIYTLCLYCSVIPYLLMRVQDKKLQNKRKREKQK